MTEPSDPNAKHAAGRNIEGDATRPVAEQLAFYREHPPRLLETLRITRLGHIDWTFDGHGGSIETVFGLACPCGSKRFAVACGVMEGEAEAMPPISLECDGCEDATDLFDPNEHGWNAIMCGDRFEEPDAYDDLVAHDIDSPHEVIVRFEYALDTLGDPECVGREPDLFTWISILARDPEDDRLAPLFDWECA